MVYIKVDEAGNFDNAVKEFMRKLKDSGLNDRLNDLRYRKKPTAKRREAKKARALKIKISNRNNRQ